MLHKKILGSHHEALQYFLYIIQNPEGCSCSLLSLKFNILLYTYKGSIFIVIRKTFSPRTGRER